MFKIGPRFLRPAVIGTAMLWALAAMACNVPVFRYALERWEADPYEVFVFHRGPLTADQRGFVEPLEEAGQNRSANLAVSRVELTAEVPPPLRSLLEEQANPTLPWMVVRYPRQLRIEKPVWAGPLSAEAVGALLDSPARRDIAQKLLSGDSVVWLLLESGDKKQDDDAGQLIEAETRKLQQTLKLPEPSPEDPPISAELPLKIAFSTVRVARADPSERLLVGMLLNRDPLLIAAKAPMLFPVFGRGRVIPPAVGAEIRAEAIREVAEFLTGPCSCQVKELNPGYDLLLVGNWSALSGYSEVMLPEPPPLVSMSQFAATAASNATAATIRSEVAPATASPSPAPVEPSSLMRNLTVVLGIGVFFLASMTFLLKLRANRSPR